MNKVQKMQKVMWERIGECIGECGGCDYCPVNVYKDLFGGTFLGSCARTNLKVLETLKLPHPPKSILDPELGVECREFSDWFLRQEVRTRFVKI